MNIPLCSSSPSDTLWLWVLDKKKFMYAFITSMGKKTVEENRYWKEEIEKFSLS